MNASPHDGKDTITDETLASLIEHTKLGNNFTEAEIAAHVDEAAELKVFGVCLPLAWIPFAKKYAGTNPLKFVTVIDFPLGQKSAAEKCEEVLQAKTFGADEIDMVLDYQALINKNYQKALTDIQAVVAAAAPIPIKVIVETSALTKEQLIQAITIVALSGASFIKTSTGFHKAGAALEDIVLMRKLLPTHVGIKASGGIKTKSSAQQMIKAGADRIGTSKSRNILLGH